ncbi:formyltetrahydrofolate deformylase [Pseudonocardia sulfidoxydans NBRC 16205]|uniref:Formyltetrahydrofolate deformylase n=1 Tax=Pseudonocardia sulfidoxydans NBRC 16205 TaxID=1223511 RepID=A0A511DFA1_9PSEU|nr:formyltetrahydrofolate deformylase [Pseudonocardia sulfidoxydans]GEL23461.1 formyltetrahydrofolate deformylase [Pseudonocardia sulfidoxydans NBRC 16205]
MTQTTVTPPPTTRVATGPGPVAATPSSSNLGRLLASCVDRPGIVSAITAFLHSRGANIVQYDQETTDPVGGRFFQRLVFHLPDLAERLPRFSAEFATEVGDRFDMTWRMRDVDVAPRVAVFVSRYDHCLLDLLWRWRRGDLPIDIVQVVSNHPDMAEAVAGFGVPYEHIPVTKATKPQAEQAQIDLLHGRVDLVVMARYMQILSGDLLDRIGAPVINIHHSFLPAFAGAGPYERAKQRGVKLIGATAHYATEDLDEGPIIEQDVIRVTHRSSAADLVRLGADIERTVLARAVKWHCEDRVMVNGRTTIVF